GTSLECELAEASIPVAILGKRRGCDRRIFTRLYRVLRQFNPDVAHTHLYSLRYALPVLVAVRPNAMAHTIHSVAEREVGTFGRATHRIASAFGVVPIAISTEVARSFQRLYGRALPTTVI